MNSDSKTWNLILEHQRAADLKRQMEEKAMKKYIRDQYKQQLQMQINSDRIARQKSQRQQKIKDRLRMDQSENNYNKYIKIWNSPEKLQETNTKPVISLSHNPQKPKQTIDAFLQKRNNQAYQHRLSYPKINPSLSSQQQNKTIQSPIRRNNSEVSISSSNNKNMDYLKRAHQIHYFQDQYKKIKSSLNQEYGTDLKRQILQKESLKKLQNRMEKNNQIDNMRNYQNYYVSLDLQKRQQKRQKSQELMKILQKQVDEKGKNRKNDEWMPQREGKINRPAIIQGNDLIIPGQTFLLDPQRKKQLETVAKSISPKKNKESENYLANRGKNFLG